MQVEFIHISIVIWIPEMEKIVAIHDVQHVDVTVDPKIRIQRKAKHPVVSPLADLVMDVEQERIISVSRILEPDLAAALPHIHAPVAFESDSDGVGPWSRHYGFSKPRRQRNCSEVTAE